MAKDMEDEIYISVALDEYLELRELQDFMRLLKEFGIEEWEGFDEAVEEFLEEDDQRDDPRELI